MNTPGAARGPHEKPPVEVIGDAEIIVVSPHLTVAREKVRFPNGHEGEFTYLKDPYVATSVVPYDKRRGKSGIVLIEQYRHPSRSWGWEIPAGRPQPGESSRQAAERELGEEARVRAELWHELPAQNTVIGRGNSRVDTHLAAGLQPVEGAHDATELINAVEWFPMERMHDMMLNGEINSSHTLGALMLAATFIQRNPDNNIARLVQTPINTDPNQHRYE